MSQSPPPILREYPSWLAQAQWVPLGSAGGFSGSELWRGTCLDGREFALKGHAAGFSTMHLERVHRWMDAARLGGMDFIPRVEPTRWGKSVAVGSDRSWDMLQWMPGRADFHEDPSDAKLVAAVEAIARIHRCWAGLGIREVPCPAVERRWRVMIAWDELVRSGWQPRYVGDDPIATPADTARRILPTVLPRLRLELSPWLTRPVTVQPCLVDVWHDHVLFLGERVSGIIDYAAAKFDHVATDLARLLGSLVPDQPSRQAAALEAYAAIRPLPNPELVSLLDRTGVAAAVVNWIKSIYYDGRALADRMAVAKRLAGLIERLRAQMGNA